MASKYTYKRDSKGDLIAYDKNGKKVGKVNDSMGANSPKKKPTTKKK